MFTGQYEHSLDEKGRVVLPSKFRLALGEKFTITRGLDGCLYVFSNDTWNAFSAGLQRQPLLSREAALLQRYFCGGAYEVSTDSQFRLAIPQALRNFADIKEVAVLVGAGDRVEIWNPHRWDAYLAGATTENLALAAQAIWLTNAPKGNGKEDGDAQA